MQAINGLGNANYATNVVCKQNQPTVEDYSNMPMVYEPVKEEQKGGSNVLGMTLLGLGGLGIGILAGKKWGAKSADEAMQALEALKNSDAVKNYETLKNATDEIAKVVENKKWYNPKTWGVSSKIQKILKPIKEEAAKAADDVAKVADDAADNAAKAADEASKAA